MQRVERSGEIDVAPAELFAFLADLDNLPEWQNGIVAAQRTSDGPTRVGSTALVARELMGQRMQAELRVTAYEPPRRLTIESTVAGVRATGRLELSPVEPAASRLTATIELRASGFAALLEPIIASTAATEIEASLRRLQERFGAPDG